MRVLIADKLPDRARVRLVTGGFEVRVDPSLNGPSLTAAIAEYEPDVLVVRSTRVEVEHLDASSVLSLVIRGGAGVNTIAIEGCSARGIHVANCPGKNAVAVAELTLGLLLAVDRRIPDNVTDFRAGQWNKATYDKAQGLAGRTLGIIGLGDIGAEVAKRAKAFDMPVVAWSRSLTQASAEALGIGFCPTPEDVARQCDVLSVHLALAPATRGLIGESIFGALPHGAVFLNTSRAEVVDDAALQRALDQRELWAGLDVVADEPAGKQGAFAHPLSGHPRVYVTHHIGASTEQAQVAVADEVCCIIEKYGRNGRVVNAVNVKDYSGADYALIIRHTDRVGVLAAVLQLLRGAKLNVQEMENTLFVGGSGAVARIHVRGQLSEALVTRIGTLDNVLAAARKALD